MYSSTCEAGLDASEPARIVAVSSTQVRMLPILLVHAVPVLILSAGRV